MKLTILGTAPGKSLLAKSHSAYLLEREDVKYLIDCGEGTTQKLLEKDLVNDELDGIIISHLHPDHFVGLFMLLQTLYLNKRTKELKIYLPESVNEITSFLSVMYMFEERFSYRFSLTLYNEKSFTEIGIAPFKNEHLKGYGDIVVDRKLTNKLLSYSFIIKGRKKSLLLSSDINSVKDIEIKLAECQALILDGIHIDVESAKEILTKSNKEVYITHGDYSKLQKKFAELFSNNVRLAKENDEINL